MTIYGVAVCDWDGRAEDIAQAISLTKVERVYLTIEDRHIMYRKDNVHEAIESFTSMGLEVILDPWGVSERFAGEATSENKYSFVRWLQFVETTKAAGILIDEPKDITEIGFTAMQCRTFAPSKFTVAALQPEILPVYKKYLGKEKIDELTVSTYLFGNQIKNATYESLLEWYYKLDLLIPKDAGVWIQTWELPEGTEWIPTALMDIFDIYCKYDKINIWAWDAFRTVSSKRPANPDLVWKNILNKIQE